MIVEMVERRVSDVALSLIRTWVPIAVAAVLAWAGTRWGIVVPDELAGEAVVWLVAGVAAVYYGLARWLEQRTGDSWPARVGRWLGKWLLGGVVRKPTYPAPGAG